MKKQDIINIGNWEISALVILSLCTQIFVGFPQIMSEKAGSAGWLLTIYVSIIALVIFSIMFKIYSKFYGMDLVDLGEYIAGAVGRVVTGLVVISFLFILTSGVVRLFSENMKIISLNLSPISFVALFFIGGMVLSAFFGLETISRINAVAVPVISFGFIIIVIAVGPYYDFAKIMPWFGKGFKEIFFYGVPSISIFADILPVFMLMPFIKKASNFRKSSLIGLLMAMFFLSSSVFSYLLVFEYPISNESFLPFFQLARLVNYGRFLQRGESVFLLMWALAAMLYLSFTFTILLHTFSKTFKLKYYKPMIFPFTVIIFALSLIPPNLLSVIELEYSILKQWGWTLSFGFPILLLLLASFKKAKEKKGVKEK